jgi:hypothetical protein
VACLGCFADSLLGSESTSIVSSENTLIHRETTQFVEPLGLPGLCFSGSFSTTSDIAGRWSGLTDCRYISGLLLKQTARAFFVLLQTGQLSDQALYSVEPRPLSRQFVQIVFSLLFVQLQVLWDQLQWSHRVYPLYITLYKVMLYYKL